MKHLSRVFLAVATLFAGVACTTDATEDLGVNGLGQTKIVLSLEESRTQLGEKAGDLYPIYWSEGDQISVNGVASNPLTAAQAGSTSAEFTVNGTHETFNIAYPAAEANQVLFAATQVHTSNSTFASGAATLYGVGSAKQRIELHHLTGVLKIGVTGSATLTHAQISTVDRTPIAGAFNIDFTNGEVAPSAAAVSTINYSFGEGVALSSAATYIHVAVPAGEYDELYITLYDNANGAMYATVKAGNTKPLTAGDVREFSNTIAYAPNASATLIKDAASLKSWAASASKSNVDAVMIADVDMSNEAWTPVDGFSGAFLGNGYAIKGLKAPLLGVTTTRGIKGLHLVDIDMEITDLPNAGALACDIQNQEAEVSHCSASGKMVINLTNKLATTHNKYYWFGGLVGYSISTKEVSDLYSNVAIETTGALTNPDSEHTRIAGVISHAGGALKNLTNVGTITHNATSNGTIILAGIVTDGATDISNCVNGIPNSDGTAGSITVHSQHKKNANLAGVTTYINGLVENCHNYGNLYTEHVANAGRLCGFAFQSQGGEVRNCSNYGKVTSASNMGTTSSTHHISGFLAYEADGTTTILYNCCNYGEIELAKDFSNRYFSLGGILARKDATESTITLEKCCNYGKIAINGTILRSCYMGGIVGLNAAKATGGLALIDCVNYGQLTANATMKQGEAFRVGGVIATSGMPLIDATQPTSNWNKGDIVLNLTDGGKAAEATGQLSVGGAIGSLSADISAVLENTSFYNEGNITVNLESGKYPPLGGIGGVIGYVSNGQVANGSSFCNISAVGHEGRVGAIAGFAHSATDKVKNCNAGGTIKVTEGETITLSKKNYATYVYPSYATGIDPIEEFAQSDKCGYISSIDATPVYAEYVREVYYIGTADELLAFAADVANVDMDVELTADIDMTGKNWTTINGYSKTFDGKNFKIKGLNAPLFGETQASFKNLHLEDVDITITASGTADVNVGVLAGNLLNADAVLENCSASGEFKVIGDSPTKTVRPCGLVSWAATAVDIKNLVNKVNITMTGTYAGTIVAAGCICATDGNNPKMIDCQNLGNIVGDATFNGNVYVLGIAGLTGDMINCVNGSADGKYGNIKVDGSTIGYLYLAGICGSKSKTRDNITGCTNYGNIEVGGTRTHKKSQYMYISGISPTCTSDAIADCTNYGDITCSIVSGSGETHQFAGIGCTNNESKLTTVKNCVNYGDITITKDAEFTNTAATVQVHGVCRVSHTVANLENLRNNGNLSVYGSVASTLYVAGVASTISSDATVNGTLANTGNITVGVAATAKASVGGIFGVHETNTLTMADGAKLVNSGKIVCNGQFVDIAQGGIFGRLAIEGAYNAVNVGDMDYLGTRVAGSSDYTVGVGGFAGISTASISGASVYCTIMAGINSGFGFVTGSARSEAVKATNCKVGGVLLSEYNVEDEEYKTTPIDASNYFNYIYGSGEGTDWTGTDNYDGCTLLTAKPNVN